MSEPTRTPGGPDDTNWAARPGMAVAVRLALFVAPVLIGLLAIWVSSRWFWSVDGTLSPLTWFVQAALIGSSTATVVDRQTRRLLPLATLLGLSLTFPGPAPSRFSVAFQAAVVRDAALHLAAAAENGLSDDAATAAIDAIGLITVRGSHGRLTSGRTEHIAAHANAVAVEMGVSDDDREKLIWSVLLHDIGELCVPPALLGANSQPTADECRALEAHTTAGESFIAPLGEWLGSWRFATSQHHERWDGSGYPKGIGGERITLSARIVAVVGAYTALTAEGSNTPERAKAQILASSGAHFDPSVVEALIAVTPIDEPSALAGVLPAIAQPGVAVHAAQATALVIVAALMATNVAATSELLALDDEPAVEAPDDSSTMTALASEPEEPKSDTPNSSTADRWEISPGELASAPKSTTTSTTALETTTTVAPTTEVPTTTAPPTTAAPTTSPPTTAPPTTVALVTTTAAPATTPPTGPVAVADDVNARADRNKRIDVLGNDAPGPSGSPIDVDTLDIVDQPAHGAVEIKSGKFSYRSEAGYLGVDTLTYRICNEMGLCSTAKVTITIR